MLIIQVPVDPGHERFYKRHVSTHIRNNYFKQIMVILALLVYGDLHEYYNIKNLEACIAGDHRSPPRVSCKEVEKKMKAQTLAATIFHKLACSHSEVFQF